MKKRNNAFARLVGLLLVLTLTVAATGGAGTSSDPLVTLSYLNEKFLPQILSEVDKKTTSREQTLSSKLTEQVKSETQAFEQKYGASSGNASGGMAASFTVVTLNQGQILYMGVGCEAMLRFAEESPLHGDGRQPRRAGEREQHKAARTRQLQRAVKSLHKEKSLCIEIAQALYFVPTGGESGGGLESIAARLVFPFGAARLCTLTVIRRDGTRGEAREAAGAAVQRERAVPAGGALLPCPHRDGRREKVCDLSRE